MRAVKAWPAIYKKLYVLSLPRPWCGVVLLGFSEVLRASQSTKWRSSLVRLATGSKDQCTGRRGSIKPLRVCQLCWPPQGLLAAKAFRNATLNLKSGSTKDVSVICLLVSHRTVQFLLEPLLLPQCNLVVPQDANHVHP